MLKSQLKDFAGGALGKILPANAGDTSLIPGLGRSHGQRILVGYSPWGREESDTIE